MSEYNDPDLKIAGLKQSLSDVTKTLQVNETAGIPYGLPVFGYSGNDLAAYRYHDNRATVLYDADFVALNSIALSVNGTSITAVVFDTDHDTTMAALVVAIEAAITGASVTLLDTGGNNRDFTITIEDGVDRVVVTTVTLGGSQAVATITNDSTLIFQGMSRFEQQGSASITDINGNVIQAATSQWDDKDAIPVMIEGDITAVTAAAITGKAAVYVVKDGADQGKLTDTVGTNVLLADIVFTETTTVAGLANVRINK